MTQPRNASIETPYGWAVVAASFSLVAIGNAALYATIVALKPIADEFDWPRAWVALGYSLAMLGTGIGGIAMGRWTDRVGMFVPVATGMTMVAVGCWVISTTSSILVFLLTHAVLVGLVGNAALYGPLVANTTRWFDRRRGIAVGIVACGQGVAGAIWTPVFRWVGEVAGWRVAYIGFAVFLLAATVPLLLVLRRPPPGGFVPAPARVRGEAAPPPARVLDLPGAAVLAVVCTAIVCCCIAMSMPLVHTVANATDLGHAPALAAQMLSVALGCAVLGRLAWGFVSDRIGGYRTLLYSSAGQALGLFLFSQVDSAAGLFLVAAVFGLGYGGVVPAYVLIVRDLFPATGIGQRMGVVLLFGTIGMALGGWLGARVFDVTGSYSTAFMTGFAFNVANLIIVHALSRRRRRYSAAFAVA